MPGMKPPSQLTSPSSILRCPDPKFGVLLVIPFFSLPPSDFSPGTARDLRPKFLPGRPLLEIAVRSAVRSTFYSPSAVHFATASAAVSVHKFGFGPLRSSPACRSPPSPLILPACGSRQICDFQHNMKCCCLHVRRKHNFELFRPLLPPGSYPVP